MVKTGAPTPKPFRHRIMASKENNYTTRKKFHARFPNPCGPTDGETREMRATAHFFAPKHLLATGFSETMSNRFTQNFSVQLNARVERYLPGESAKTFDGEHRCIST